MDSSGTLRALAAFVIALLIVGCELLDGGGQLAGDMLPDASIVINRGELNGRPWGASAVQRGNEVCIVYEGAGLPGRGHCTSRDSGTSMSAEWIGHLSLAHGFTALSAVVVRVETNAGVLEVPAVPLDRLGFETSAFVVVLPGHVELRRLSMLDGSGRTVDTVVLDR